MASARVRARRARGPGTGPAAPLSTSRDARVGKGTDPCWAHVAALRHRDTRRPGFERFVRAQAAVAARPVCCCASIPVRQVDGRPDRHAVPTASARAAENSVRAPRVFDDGRSIGRSGLDCLASTSGRLRRELEPAGRTAGARARARAGSTVLHRNRAARTTATVARRAPGPRCATCTRRAGGPPAPRRRSRPRAAPAARRSRQTLTRRRDEGPLSPWPSGDGRADAHSATLRAR